MSDIHTGRLIHRAVGDLAVDGRSVSLWVSCQNPACYIVVGERRFDGLDSLKKHFTDQQLTSHVPVSKLSGRVSSCPTPTSSTCACL